MSVFFAMVLFSLSQDGNTFCTTLTPRLFTMDLTIMEHKVFFHEVFVVLH